MLGVGSSTLYKIAIKEDGSPNWPGVIILASTGLVIFFWRCVVIVPESSAAVRIRFGGVAYAKHTSRSIENGFKQFRWSKEYGKGVRLRLYSVHSLAVINVTDRKTELENKTITYYDRDYTASPSIIWRVSTDPGCPSKALFNVQDSKPKDQKNAELEQIVRDLVDNAIVTALQQARAGSGDCVFLACSEC